jgi:AcrR family transcriptional regulator
VALYDATDGSVTNRALAEGPTARAAVEVMLRGNAEYHAAPGKPSGCMIVLSATLGAPGNAGVRDHLARLRRGGQEALQRRLEQGIAGGDVPEGVDTAALAAFYTAVLQGLSVQARDGAAREDLHGVVDAAMAAWGALAAPPGGRSAPTVD